MKLKSRNFPHPVLHPTTDDIINSHFAGQITNYEVRDGFLDFTLQFKLKNDTLNNLFQGGSAHLNVHFECVSTMQRLSFKLNLDDCETNNVDNNFIYTSHISIESNLLNKKADVNYFILANEGISNYSNDNMHPDFSDATFNIEKGDILALAITQTLHLEKEDLVTTNSIFRIVKGSSTNSPFTIAMNNNQIEIILPASIHEKIGHFKIYGTEANKVLIQMIYYPALLDVLHNLQMLDLNELEEYESLDWYITLEKRLRGMGEVISKLSSENLSSIAYNILYENIDMPWMALEHLLDREDSDDHDNSIE